MRCSASPKDCCPLRENGSFRAESGPRGHERPSLGTAWGGSNQRKHSAAQAFGAAAGPIDPFEALAHELFTHPVGRFEVRDGLGDPPPVDQGCDNTMIRSFSAGVFGWANFKRKPHHASQFHVQDEGGLDHRTKKSMIWAWPSPAGDEGHELSLASLEGSNVTICLRSPPFAVVTPAGLS